MSQKVAWVTGGGSGIGAESARVLADAGWTVAISGRDAKKLDEQVKRRRDGRLVAFPLDVADREATNAVHRSIVERLGVVGLLVNAAGLNVPRRSMADLVPEEWDTLLQVNATGAFNCTYAVVPGMRRMGDGLIVQIASIAGIRSAPLGGIAYNASKFAMTAMGIAVGEEERVNGIRVTVIHPGEVDTPIMQYRPHPVSAERRETMLKAEDVAAAVGFVASLPPRAHVWELVIKPTVQSFV
jgi:NADP-dependent 3-hydroxy acid dehydrogenase YdfG